MVKLGETERTAMDLFPAAPRTVQSTPLAASRKVVGELVKGRSFGQHQTRLRVRTGPFRPGAGRVLAGIRRKGRDRGRGQVQGVDFAKADAAAVAANDGTLKGLRDAALIEDGPLFRRVHKGGGTVGDAPLSTVSVRNIIKRRCADSGLEGAVSGHSLRVGGAQSLAAGGASIAEMQTAGQWTSPQMPGHYARGQLAARGAVARIRYSR